MSGDRADQGVFLTILNRTFTFGRQRSQCWRVFPVYHTSYNMISFLRRTPPNALVLGIYALLIAFAVLAFMNPQ